MPIKAYIEKEENKCIKHNVNKLRYIGKNSDVYDNIFRYKCNIDYLPIVNLPCVYFPFYNENVKLAKDFINKIVDGISYDTIDNLLFNVANINQKFQPYNNNLTLHIMIFIFCFWIFIFFYILRYIYIKYNSAHLYFILGCSIILLLGSSAWALVITSQNI